MSKNAPRDKSEPEQADYNGVNIPGILQKITEESSLTPIQIQFIQSWMEHNGNITIAAEECGINRQNWYNWIQKKEFKEAVDKFNVVIAYKALSKVVNIMDSGKDEALQLKAATELLKGFHPNFKSRVDITSGDEKITGINLNIQINNGTTD